MPSHPANVLSGIDVAAATEFEFLNGAIIGVLAHQASVDKSGRDLIELLQQSPHCRIRKLFAPEHGYHGKAQDMEPVDNERNRAIELEIVSLYGRSESSLKPTIEDFAELDALLVDLRDIGTRYYTYAQTLAYCMETAGRSGTKIYVLDRPNPIGGEQIEGSLLSESCRSFCGIGPIANRHGLTLGELARLFQNGIDIGGESMPPRHCDLEVIGVEGWRRSMYLDDTDVPWVNPSPNMRSLEAAIAYPGTCLFETTNLSEGRGSDHPLQQIGAPYVDPERWLEAIHEASIPLDGARFEPVAFTPTFQKYSGQLCHGLRLRIEDRKSFQPYRCGIAMLYAAATAFPEDFHWRKDPYEFVSDVPAIDLLFGSHHLRRAIEYRLPVDSLLSEMEDFEGAFQSIRDEHLLY